MVRVKLTFNNGVVREFTEPDYPTLFEKIKGLDIKSLDSKVIKPSEIRQGKEGKLDE